MESLFPVIKHIVYLNDYHQWKTEFERIYPFFCTDNHQVSLGCDQHNRKNSADPRDELPVHHVIESPNFLFSCNALFYVGHGLVLNKERRKPYGVSPLTPPLSSSFPTQMARPTSFNWTPQDLPSPCASLVDWGLMFS